MPASSVSQSQVPDGLTVVEPDDSGVVSAEVVVVGSGMGGGTLARSLASAGVDVLVVERGGFLPREWENWSPRDVFARGRYKNAEQWLASDGSEFAPGVYYYVGGNTKFYGAMLPRFRETDFQDVAHLEGVAPAWPISYADLEPYYCMAEEVYRVRATADDPSAPWRSRPYPYPALQHESAIAELAASLRRNGLHPFVMPAAIDFGEGGACVRCGTCDGYPCLVDAKGDADVNGIRPALLSGARLLTNTTVRRVAASDGRHVTELRAERHGRQLSIRGRQFVLAAGAVNTAALLLRSEGAGSGRTLANGSDQVGRNYMVHNSTFFVAVNPLKRNPTRFQKTLAINDWYLGGGPGGRPLGNVQMLGKLNAPMVTNARPWIPEPVLSWATGHSIDLYLTSEDLPDRDNRITLSSNGRITVHWKPNNLSAHRHLLDRTKQALRGTGYRLRAQQRMGIEVNSHQCGTAVMGDDPARSVVDRNCRTHDVDNLWLADSSVFPSSAALNPALTIAANALRVAEVVLDELRA